MSDSDTIAAIATAPGEGGVAIIRVSGARCFAIADAVFACPAPPPSRRPGGTFVHGRVVGADGETIDEALLLIMRAPHSYTREDTVEVQGHGGPIVARRILERILAEGARAAEPGEFTKRAFLNGRLDLTQAEAVLDLIRARSDRAAAAALDQLEGRLSREFNSLYDRLVTLLGHLEATLDFSDQEIPPNILDPVADRLADLIGDMDRLLSTWNEGHLLRDGATVVIAGRPNVGKSTLLNALLGRPRAIVSDVPGTTRDTIAEPVIMGGYPITLVDTAGLRDTQCSIEQEGIRRTRREIAQADLCLYVIDASREPDPEDQAMRNELDPAKTIFIGNKCDISINHYQLAIYTSSTKGDGLDSLRSEIVRRLNSGAPHSIHHAAISTRHQHLLSTARERTAEALDSIKNSGTKTSDIAAANLRDAADQLGQITGREPSDDLLASIFSQFCIGK